MAVCSERRFARLLRRLSADELAAYVADLYLARGHDVARDGQCVRVTTGAGTRTVVAVADRQPEETACQPDVVVTPRSTAGVEQLADGYGADVHDPADLRSMVRYAVPRETANRLCEKHLGRPFITDGDDWLASRIPVPLSSHSLAAVAVAIGLVFASTLAVAGMAVPALHDTLSSDAQASAPTIETNGTVTVASSNESGDYLPGLNASGIADVDTLAVVHSYSLAGRSYRMVTTHEGSRRVPVTVGRPDPVVGAVEWRYENATQVARVAAAGTYHYTVNGTRSIGGTTDTVRYAVYANRNQSYSRARTDEGVFYWQMESDPHDPSSGSPHVTRARRYITRYLATDSSSVSRVLVGGELGYRIVATGEPTRLSRPVDHYRAVALVTADGVVRELDVSYNVQVADGGPTVRRDLRPVQFHMRYGRLDQQTVTPPAWVDPARKRLTQLANTTSRPSTLQYPPGIGVTGVLDAGTLANAHEQRVQNQSYRWRVHRNGSVEAVPGSVNRSLLRGEAREYTNVSAVVRVASPTRYRYTITRRAAGRSPLATPDEAAFANGTQVLYREDEAGASTYRREQSEQAPTSAVFASLASRYIEQYLADRAASVQRQTTDNRTYYRVRIPLNPTDLGGADYYAIAQVSERGFVRSLRVRSEQTRSALVFSFSYTGVGNTTVSRPSWYEEAHNSTKIGYVSDQD